MWGVSTHVSNPNSSTAFTTALKNKPDTLGLAPSLPRIHSSRPHLFFAFQMFPTTDGQSSSTAVNTRYRYLKEVTILIGLP